MHTYMLEYQDPDSIIWDNKHKIILYRILMEYKYNIMFTNQKVMIGSYPYLHWYHEPHLKPYRINLQHHH